MRPHKGLRRGKNNKSWAKERLLVIPRTGLSEEHLHKCLKKHCKFHDKERLADTNVYSIELNDGDDEVALMEQLKKDPTIKSVELDMAVPLDVEPDDPGYKESYALPLINAPEAWEHTQGEGVIVAVLDTGVDANHPDLKDNLVPGWNVKDNNADTSDAYGHGTKVAGVIASARGNKVGSNGVAYKAKIMPIRIAGSDGYALFSHMVAGIRWAMNNGARVVNLSYANAAGSKAINMSAKHMSINNQGVSVISAGNTGGKLDYEVFPDFLAVSGTDSNDKLASWSSYGTFVDLCAPGVSIYTTTKGGGYGKVSGTSFAAPMVAGSVALIMAQDPSLTAAEVEHVLLSNTKPLATTDAEKEKFGAGRVDIGKAIKSIVPEPKDTTPPTVSITSLTEGMRVGGLVFIDVQAEDASGIEWVKLYVNGMVEDTDYQAPYGFAWDTSKILDGTYKVLAAASDTEGNYAESEAITVHVKNFVEPEPPKEEPPKEDIPSIEVIEEKLIAFLVQAIKDFFSKFFKR